MANQLIKIKKWINILLLGFLLNFVWENLHSILYVHYKGGEITQFILLRAAIVDASILLALFLIFKGFDHPWLIVSSGIIIAIVIERLALCSGRWAYADIMPIIPIIEIGLSPAIQLGLTGYIVYKFLHKSG